MWGRLLTEERTMAKKARAKQMDAAPSPLPASPRSLMQRLAALQEEFAQQVRQQDPAAQPQPEPQPVAGTDATAPASTEAQS
jgi:hypothetical protein